VKRWSPGFGVFLENADEKAIPGLAGFRFTPQGGYLNQSNFSEKRKSSAKWISTLLENSLEKEPSFGCFGMHEWAMVYKANNIRHSQFPLRLPAKKLAEFVESRPLVCTHFDAFRFFTKP